MADHRFTTTFAAGPGPRANPSTLSLRPGRRPQHTSGTAHPAAGSTHCHQNVRSCRARVT